MAMKNMTMFKLKTENKELRKYSAKVYIIVKVTEQQYGVSSENQ